MQLDNILRLGSKWKQAFCLAYTSINTLCQKDITDKAMKTKKIFDNKDYFRDIIDLWQDFTLVGAFDTLPDVWLYKGNVPQ